LEVIVNDRSGSCITKYRARAGPDLLLAYVHKKQTSVKIYSYNGNGRTNVHRMRAPRRESKIMQFSCRNSSDIKDSILFEEKIRIYKIKNIETRENYIYKQTKKDNENQHC
jgi:hypothetical protein